MRARDPSGNWQWGVVGGTGPRAIGQRPLCTAGTPLARAAAAGPLSEPLGIVLCVRPGRLCLLSPDQTCFPIFIFVSKTKPLNFVFASDFNIFKLG